MLSRARLEIKVPIEQTIRVSAIHGKTHYICRLFYLSVFDTMSINSDEGSTDISDTF